MNRVSIKKTLHILREQKPWHVNKCSVVSRKPGPTWPWKEVSAREKELIQGPLIQRTQEASRSPRVLKAQSNTDQNHEWVVLLFSRENQIQEVPWPSGLQRQLICLQVLSLTPKTCEILASNIASVSFNDLIFKMGFKNVKGWRYFGKQFSKFFQKLNINLPHDLAMPFLGNYPRDMKTYVHTKSCA